MAKFYGGVGYTIPTETAPGVWSDVIVERNYYGDVTRNTRQLTSGESINNDLTISNSISIVADAYAHEHFFAIRYVRWAGAAWSVTDVEVARPRLILRIGGLHNGPKATTPSPFGADPQQ